MGPNQGIVDAHGSAPHDGDDGGYHGLPGAGMSDVRRPILEAVEALRTYGLKVEPWSGGYPLWLVDGETLTGGQLLVLAARLGLMGSAGRRQ